MGRDTVTHLTKLLEIKSQMKTSGICQRREDPKTYLLLGQYISLSIHSTSIVFIRSFRVNSAIKAKSTHSYLFCDLDVELRLFLLQKTKQEVCSTFILT